MPRILGDFRLVAGERSTVWAVDVDYSYHYRLGDPYAGWDFTFRNGGIVELFTEASGSGINAQWVVNDATGVIRMTGGGVPSPPGFPGIGVAAGSGVVVVNDGLVSVSGPQNALGLMASVLMLNRGTIEVEAGEAAWGVQIEMMVDFVNTGSITVEAGLQAIGVQSTESGLHANYGNIVARATDPTGISAAWYAYSFYSNPVELLNAGIMEGDYAYYSYGGGGLASVLAISDTIRNTATGEMRGAISTAFGDDVVVNDGLITGPILLGFGADIYDGADGIQRDWVDGEDGDDTLIGGDDVDYMFGGHGRDVVLGGGGNDLIEGGRGADTLDGGDGVDTLSYLDSTRGVVVDLAAGTASGNGADVVRNFEGVLGSAWNDRITGSSGFEVLEGLAGDDILNGGDGGDVLLGGRGADRLTGGAGSDVFAFTTGDGKDIVEDFTANDVLAVYGYAKARSVTQVGADVLVTLSDTDSILLRGVQASLLTADRLTFSAAPLPPETTAGPQRSVITGDHLVIETGERLVLDEPGPAVVAGWYVGAIGAFLYETQDYDGERPAFWNAGEINVRSSGDYGQVIGVWNASFLGGGPDTFHNQESGVISAINDGVTMTTGARVGSNNAFNDGRIEARGGGDVWGVEVVDFVNTGEIIVHAGGAAQGIHGGYHLWNSGLIEVHSHEAGAGMLFTTGRTIVNTGTIRVTDDTAAIDSMGISYSLSPYGGEYLLNTGVIEADYALRFGSVSDSHNPNQSNVQKLWNTGELRGRVSLSENREALVNQGLITGAIELRHGDDLFDGRGGTQAGGVDGGDGNDTIYGGAGVDTLSGGAGIDELAGGGGADILTGGDGMDRFVFAVGDGADVITDFSLSQSDQIRLIGYSSWQSVTQVGADTLVRLSDTDSILLRNFTASALTTGQFWFNYSALPPAANARTAPPPPTPVAPPAPEPARPWTTSGVSDPVPIDTAFTGTDGRDARVGGAGIDVMDGLGGYDALEGLGGDDQLNGGDGDDSLSGNLGADRLMGGTGDDLLNGGAGDDVLDGGDGLDLADYSGAASGVDVDLTITAIQNTLGAGSDRLISIERLAGSDHDDILRGTTGANQLFGGDGDDRLEGRGGADYFDGGDGEDTIVFTGVRSAYTLAWTNDAADGVTVTGADGVSRAVNAEWLQFSDQRVSAARSIFTFSGSAAADTVTGTNFNDLLDGGDGDDVLNGRAGDDVLHGGDGADRLSVSSGNHRVFGDAGDDILTATAAKATGSFALPSRPHTTVLLDGGEGNDQINFSTSGLAIDDVTAIGGGGDDFISVRGAKEAMIDAGAGNDLIVLHEVRGGLTVRGGDGQDTYQLAVLPKAAFHPAATIIDFQVGPGGDRFDPWTYMAAVFPDVPYGENLFEAGYMRVSQRGRWLDVEILTGPGPDGYFTTVTTLVDVTIDQFSTENFVGMAVGSSFGPYAASGDAGDNVLIGNDQRNVLAGYAGADVLYGGGGDDWLLGGLGPDILYGGDGNDLIQTGGATDSERNVIGDGDVAYGGAGDDILMGGVINERLYGGTGDDVYDGYQIAYEFANEGVDSVFHAHGRTLEANVENLFLSWTDGAHLQGQFDTFEARTGTGNAVDNRIVGASGADTLRGLGGHDRLEGLDGNDILNGDAGDDLLTGGRGDNSLNGGAGTDTAAFSGLRSTYTISTVNGVTRVTGPDGTDTLRNVERLLFADGAFDLNGGAVTNVVLGSASHDNLAGSGGVDHFLGGGGDDVFTGGAGNDIVDGGSGNDTLIVSGAFSDYRLLMNGDDFILKGADGGDRLTGVESIRFADGRVLELNRMYGPGVDSSAWADGRIPESLLSGGSKEDDGQPMVLPGPGDSDVRDHKGDDGPQILPGGFDPAPGARGHGEAQVLPGAGEARPYLGLESRFVHERDGMPTMDGAGGATALEPAHRKGADAFVLPGLSDDHRLVLPGLDAAKDIDQPQILPGSGEETLLLLTLEDRVALSGDWMLTMDGELVARHDDWM